MRTLLRVLAVAGAIVVVLVVAALLYLTFGDLSRFQPRIEAAVAEMLGREFRIDGDLDIEVLPHPSATATGIYLANAEWASAEPMLTIGRAAIEIDLWSLLSGPVVIEQLEISDVSALLEQDDDGRANYVFETAEEATDESEPESEPGSENELPVILEHAAIESVAILVRRPATDDVTIAVDSLDIVTSEDQMLSAVLAGRFQDLSVGLDAEVWPLSAIRSRGEMNYRLAAMLDDAGVAVEGSLDSLFASAPREDGGVVRQHLRFDGSIASLNLLGAVFDVGNLPEQEMTLTGDLAFGADGVAVDPIAIAIGDSDFAGSASVEFSEPLAIVVAGESTLLDLTPFMPPQEAAAAAGDGGAGAAEPGPDTDADADAAADDGSAGDPMIFSTEPLPLEPLRSVDLQMDLAAGKFRLRDIELDGLEVALVNAGGQARLATSFTATHGGSAEGEVMLDASAGDSAALDVDFTFSDVRLNVMSAEVEDPEQIPPIGLALDVTAMGDSAHALAASANGRVVLTQGTGLIANNAVGLVSGDVIAQLFSALNPFAEEEEFTELQCTIVALNLTDGLGTLDPVLLETDKLQIVGGGEIELETEALNIEFNTKPRSGVGVTADMFVTPFVKLSGTLAEPGIGLNARGALLQGGAAVLTGGATLLLGGLADRATAQADQCESTLAALETPADSADEDTDSDAE